MKLTANNRDLAKAAREKCEAIERDIDEISHTINELDRRIPSSEEDHKKINGASGAAIAAKKNAEKVLQQVRALYIRFSLVESAMIEIEEQELSILTAYAPVPDWGKHAAR